MSTAGPGAYLSVVVPTYRAPELLAGALRSLAAQDFDPGRAEVLVVDDGSPDFDPAPLRDLTSPLPVVVIHFDRNRGRAAARNAGIRAASGSVVVFLDADMTVDPGFLRAHDDFHRRRQPAAAVGAIRWAEHVPDTAVNRYVASRGVARLGPGPVPYKCFVTGNSSVPRPVLVDLGGFDEGFSAYGGEDLELGYRLHREGLSVHFLPAARSRHHRWRDLEGMCQAMSTYGHRGLPRLLERHPELAEVLRLRFLERPRLHPGRWPWDVVLADPVFRAVRRVALGARGRRLPDVLFDYLWWAARTRGYLAAAGRRRACCRDS